MAGEDLEAGLASLHLRGRGRPKFHYTKDAGRSLLVRDQVRGVREQRLGGNGAPVRDVQRPEPRTGATVREREGAPTSLAEISATAQQTTSDDILEQKVRDPPLKKSWKKSRVSFIFRSIYENEEYRMYIR